MAGFVELCRVLRDLFRYHFYKNTTMNTEPNKEEAKQAQAAEERTLNPLQFSWMKTAHGEEGVKEVAGVRHHPRIIEYHSTTTLDARTDEVPWCSSFVNWVMQQAGYTGTRSARALSWGEWGQQLIEPIEGCIVVTKRKGGGHVGFFIREDADYIWLLGGNQNNEVRVSMFKKSTRPIVAYVLPAHMNDEDLGLYETISRIV